MAEDSSSSSLTGKVQENAGWQTTNQFHRICWLFPLHHFSYFSSPINIQLADNFRISLQLKQCSSLPNSFSPEVSKCKHTVITISICATISGPFWPTGLPSFVAACQGTFLTFFNSRNCGYFATFCCVGIAHRIDGIEQAVVDWTGHETCIGQVSWFGSKKRFAFFAPENSWGLDFFTVSSRGFCPQGRKPSGP